MRTAPVWLIFPLLLAACGGGSPAPEASSDATPSAPVAGHEGPVSLGEAIPIDVSAPEPDVAPPGDALHPVLGATGPVQGAVTGLVVDLIHPAIPSEAVGETLVEGPSLTPPAEGRWTWTARDTLSFEADAPLPPGTTYTLTLSQLDTPLGPIDWSPAAELSLTTPAPALAALVLPEDPDPEARVTGEVRLRFTAPVDPAVVARALGVRLDGVPVPVRPRAAEGRHELGLSLSSTALRRGSELTATLGTPIAHEAGGTVPATTVRLALPDAHPHPVRIEAVSLVEGSSGWSIDVVCDDPAAPGSRRYRWLRRLRRSFQLSSRCELDPASLSAIRTVPPLDLEVVPTSTGFRLSADLPRGRVALRLPAGLRTVDGGLLQHDHETLLQVPGRAPTLRFTQVGRYLPRDGWTALPLEHRNLPEAEVVIRHIPTRNLLFWLTGSDERASSRSAEVVARATVPLRAPADTTVTTFLPVDDLIGDPEPGVYEVAVTTPYASESTALRVQVSDLSLVAKRTGEGAPGEPVQAWVLDAHDTSGVAGAELRLVRPSGEVLDTCTSGPDGGCLLTPPDDPLDATPAFAILAEKGDDLTHLVFDEVGIAVSEDDVSGLPYGTPRPWRVSAWPDRGVYRPGEVAHLTALVRDADAAAPASGLPVRVRVHDPAGQVVRVFDTTPHATGFVTVDLPLSDYTTTGTWTMRVLIADEVVAQSAFAVEEFVPERMEVEAAPSDAARHGVVRGDPVPIEVDARYLFGGSAEGSEVELSCRLDPGRFAPPASGELTYGPRRAEGDDRRGVSLGAVRGTLDADGHTTLTCPPLSEGASVSGTATVLAEVAVFEAGSGRATRAATTVSVHPAPHYVGLATGTPQAAVGEPLQVTGRVVDWQGAVLPHAVDTVEVALIRLESEWGWFHDEQTGMERYHRRLREVVEARRTVSVTDGRFELTATPSTAASGFVVRVTSGAQTTELALDMEGRHWWWSGGTDTTDRTPSPVAPTRVPVQGPEAIEVGDPATVRFDAPFAGRALLTVETDQVVASRWLDVEAGPVSWSFTLDAFTANVYVGVLVLADPHAEGGDTYRPERAAGHVSLPVAPTAYTHALSLDVPDEVRSETTLEVGVTVPGASGPTAVVVAAVDEGILSLTDHASPDPFPDLFPRHALGVSTHETLGWTLARTLAVPTSHTGGGGDSLPARVSPVEPVALWSGLVTLDDRGRATIPLELPGYRGKLRVMAVSAGPERMGHADATVVVRDPLVVQATLPRFLIEGDQAEIPVFLTNASGTPRDVTLSLQAEVLPGPGSPAEAGARALSITGASEATLSLPDGASETAVFRLTAELPVGAARLTVTATADELTSTETLVVPFSPAAPRVRRSQQLDVTPGPMPLAPHLQGWLPTTEHTRLWLTDNPYSRAFTHLEHVVRYPYGCVEQTTSSTRPLLYVSTVAPALLSGVEGRARVDEMVRAGLERILSMQTPSGGFAYWPGGREPHLWGTAYATHLLLDARDHQHDVPMRAVDAALDWLSEQVAEPETGTRRDDVAWRHAQAYAHYVLARAGQPHKAVARALRGHLRGTDPGASEADFLLTAALFLAGDRRLEDALRHPRADAPGTGRHGGATFHSPLRERGLMLSVHQDLFDQPVGGDAEDLARVVVRGLSARASRGYTTQEIAWAITALGKRLGAPPTPQQVVPTLTGAGQTLEPVSLGRHGVDHRWSLPRASEIEDLTLTVNRPTSLDGLFLMIDSVGVRPEADWELGGEGLSLTRTWFDAQGTPVDPRELSLGDVVYTRIRLRNRTDEPIDNVALVDRFAAGWELENARLGGAAAEPLDWMDVGTLWRPDHMNLRDDRLEAFGTVPASGEVVLYHASRAVTAGTFTIPPVSAEAMYDPGLWARAAGGVSFIDGSWEGDYL